MRNYATERDLPYWTSPPIQYTYRSTAALAGGLYTWADAPTALTPVRPVRENYLYYFRDITTFADVEEADYTAALSVIPEFRMHLRGHANAVLFREPFIVSRFFQNFGYRLYWQTMQDPDALNGSIRGSLIQTPALIGKASITITVVIAAQEIVDNNYIDDFKRMYPAGGGK